MGVASHQPHPPASVRPLKLRRNCVQNVTFSESPMSTPRVSAGMCLQILPVEVSVTYAVMITA